MEVKCPICGRTMEFGRVFGKGLLWSPKEHKWTVLGGKDDVSLYQGEFPEAWICKTCRRVVLHY